MSVFKDTIAAATRPERVFPLLLRGDLIARHQELDMQLTEIQNEAMGEDLPKEAYELAEQIQALEVEADAETLHLTIRALSNTTWRNAVAAHPKKDEDGEDDTDLDALFDDVLPDSIREAKLGTDGDPAPLDAEDIDSLKDSITAAQRQALINIIVSLNGRDNSVPFSRIGSLVRQTSDKEQNSPEPTESASDDSTAGNPDK